MTTGTKERPITFSGPLILRILRGEKTQTRRVAKRPPSLRQIINATAPYGHPGDRLWVKETYAVSHKAPKCQVAYRADGRCYGIGGDGGGGFVRIFHGWLIDSTERGDRPGDTLGRSLYGPWKSGRFMPRWASRIDLELLATRKEPLRNITDEDAIAEGFECLSDFIVTWDALNPGDGRRWAHNPTVNVVTFRLITEPQG